MIIAGSINYTTNGRKRKTTQRVRKVKQVFKPLKTQENYRRETPTYPSVEMKGFAADTSQEYKKEVSQNYTIAPAYNKGAYQVIPRDAVKDIGK